MDMNGYLWIQDQDRDMKGHHGIKEGYHGMCRYHRCGYGWIQGGTDIQWELSKDISNWTSRDIQARYPYKFQMISFHILK